MLFFGNFALFHSIDNHIAIDDRERVARNGNATLDIVLALIDGTSDDRKILFQTTTTLGVPILLLIVAQYVVVGLILTLQKYGVARREIEYHDVVALDLSQTLQTVIRALNRLRIGLCARLREGHCVMNKRERDWRVGHLRTVCNLAHVEVVAHEQRALHRR